MPTLFVYTACGQWWALTNKAIGMSSKWECAIKVKVDRINWMNVWIKFKIYQYLNIYQKRVICFNICEHKNLVLCINKSRPFAQHIRNAFPTCSAKRIQNVYKIQRAHTLCAAAASYTFGQSITTIRESISLYQRVELVADCMVVWRASCVAHDKTKFCVVVKHSPTH